ncbi:hypothetical protein RQM59_02860 [Flavobacteriaceae bacterium S356]|uniref:Uncharacterized protein n=1 Tax=Asprobacillus argus TaxID=3076534 RepID=A0ABU3LDB8_9FLAO|nr:hypothetical protein [Flavobacteriaceae bacterium S356]
MSNTSTTFVFIENKERIPVCKRFCSTWNAINEVDIIEKFRKLNASGIR